MTRPWLKLLQVYKVEVVTPTTISLKRTKTITRRYSDFHKLRAGLLKENHQLVSSLPFPQKQFFRSHQDNLFIQTRLQGLQQFLTAITQSEILKKKEAFQAFLCSPSYEDQASQTVRPALIYFFQSFSQGNGEILEEAVELLRKNLVVTNLLETELKTVENLVRMLILLIYYWFLTEQSSRWEDW